MRLLSASWLSEKQVLGGWILVQDYSVRKNLLAKFACLERDDSWLEFLGSCYLVLSEWYDCCWVRGRGKCVVAQTLTLFRFCEYESHLRSNEHYLSSSESKA